MAELHTRAKFLVDGADLKGETLEVHARPVMGGGDENKTWAKYTPQGELKLSIDNPALRDAFHKGDEIYLDISLAAPAGGRGLQAGAAKDVSR